MKHDPRTDGLIWPDKQRFFLSCWYNMAHEHSLDSYRVRTMNSVNALRELELLSRDHVGEEDRKIIVPEACQILSADLVLQAGPWKDLTDDLCALLKDPKALKKPDRSPDMIAFYCRELLGHIAERYVEAALDWLIANLTPPPASPQAAPSGVQPPSTAPGHSAAVTPAAIESTGVSVATAARAAVPPAPANTAALSSAYRKELEDIRSVTGSMLSAMLDAGASLESLFALYQNVLLRRVDPTGVSHSFDYRMATLRRIILGPAISFKAIFTVNGITNPSSFPGTLGPVSFDAVTPTVVCAPKHTKVVSTYLAPAGDRLYASITLEGREDRHIAARAYDEINAVLDLARFEYERGQIRLAEHCLVGRSAPGNAFRLFPIPGVIPNPAGQMSSSDLPAFVSGVNELLSGGHINVESRNRVLSAFRLYRLGADAKSFENKLVNWWTAIEYLVKGSHGGSIGKTIESFLVPALCLSYARKQLDALLRMLAELNISITDSADGSVIEFRRTTTAEFHALLKVPALVFDLLAAVKKYPHICLRVQEIKEAFENEATTKAFIASHDTRLRWQIQRIYRARCDIVHSAECSVSAGLLCANLEFYLKSILTTLLRELDRVKTLSGPAEYFLRSSHAYERLKADLAAGRSGSLVQGLV